MGVVRASTFPAWRPATRLRSKRSSAPVWRAISSRVRDSGPALTLIGVRFGAANAGLPSASMTHIRLPAAARTCPRQPYWFRPKLTVKHSRILTIRLPSRP